MKQKQKNIDTRMTERILMLLGIASHVIIKHISDHETNSDCQWFFHALEEVIYRNKPIPPFEDDIHRGLEITDGKVTGLK